MRIAFIVPFLYGGGAERVVSVFSSLLAEDGKDVVVFAFYDVGEKYKLSNKVKYVPVFQSKEEYKKTNIFKRMKKIKKTILSNQIDVLIPFVTYVGYLMNLLFYKRRFAIIETIRTSPYINNGFIKNTLRNFSFYHSDGVIFQTKYQLHFFDEKKIKKYLLLTNPINQNERNFCPKHSIKKFVFIGRLTAEKNPLLLLNGFSALVNEHSEYTLDIFGTGPLEHECLDFVFKNKLQDNITFHGFKNITRDILNEYDCLLLTSDVEGVPNALLEAMSCGLVCVSSYYNQGIDDIVSNGVNGFVFEKGNLLSFKEKLFEVSKLSAQQIQAVSLQAIKTIEINHNPSKLAEDLYNFLNSVRYEK